MAEADDEGRITRAYGFNPGTQQQKAWSTLPIWLAELKGKTSLTEASFHYIVTDHLGTPILATDKQGNKTWRGYAEAFGSTGIENGSTTSINLRFPGQYFDPETGLHQNWYRDYFPSTGRYAQYDPVRFRGIANPYAYAGNNSSRYIDPEGKFALPAICAAGPAGLAFCGGFAIAAAWGVWHSYDYCVNGLNTSPWIYSESKEDGDGGEPRIGESGGDGAGKDFSPRTKDKIRERDDNKCVFCGVDTTDESGPDKSEIDHAIPKADGGNNSENNGQNTCRTCNRQKGRKTTQQYIEWLNKFLGK